MTPSDHPDRRAAVRRLALAAPLLLAGCSGTLLPKPPAPPRRYTLDDGTPATPPRAAAAGASTLLVAQPRAAAGFDSTKMIYLRQPQALEAFAFHEWVDTPALMLAPLLVRALQASGSFRAVLLAPTAASAEWRLETTLIRLQQDFSTPPSRVRLTLRAVLLNGATRQAVAWREFDRSVAAASDDPVAGVAAARQATRQVLAALAVFCADPARPAAEAGP
jgi:cholesterol transport system auxiliary component